MSLDKRYLRIAGIFVTVICVLFVGRTLLKHSSALQEIELDASFFKILILGSLFGVLGNGFIAVGWHSILRLFGHHFSYLYDLSVVFKTQIGKYLPGNVFHYGGRVFFYTQEGISLKRSGFFLVCEIIGVVLAGAGCGLFFLLSPGMAFAALLLSIVLLCGMGLLATKRFGERIGIRVSAAAFLRLILCILISYLILSVAMFVPVIAVSNHLAGDLAANNVFRLFGAFTISWIAGYVVIGSPGGIGVREATFLVLTTGILAAEIATLAIITARITSVIGDALCFSISFIVPKQRNTD